MISLGLMVSALGLLKIDLLAWSSFDLWTKRDSVFFIIAAIIIEISARYFKISRYLVGFIIAVVIAAGSNYIWPLIVCLWFLLASFCLGQIILSVLRIKTDNISELTSMLIGAGVYGTAVGLIAHYPVSYPGLYALALVLPVLYKNKSIISSVSVLKEAVYNAGASHNKTLDILIIVIALMHFLVALMPEVGHDALAMHLFIPNHLFYRHEWGFDATTYVWAVMPMLGDWLYSIVYMLAGESSARLLNVSFIFIISFIIREIVIWAGGSSSGSKWAVLIFLTTPLTYTISSSLFIEAVWAAFITAGALSVFKLISSVNEQEGNIIATGLLLAFALVSKAVSFIILPFLLLVLIVRYHFWFKAKYIQYIAISFALFTLIGAIPYITAFYLTENPLFPFYNEYFKSSLWPEANFKSGFNAGVTWDLLYQALFHSDKYMESRPGATGFQWLILFVPAFVWSVVTKHYRCSLLFVVAILSILVTFNSTAYLRYIFPQFALVTAGIGVMLSLENDKPSYILKSLYIISGIVVLLNVIFFKNATSYGSVKLQPLMSYSDRNDYLAKRLPIRNAVQLVNLVNSPYAPVAVFSTPLTAGLNADALYANWYNHNFNTLVNKANSSDELVQVFIKKDVRYLILDKLWGSEEKRLLIEGVTEKIADFGSISVREISDKYKFITELIKNPDFTIENGWSFPASPINQSADSIIVDVANPAIQSVQVKPGKQYLNEISAMCYEQKTQGRIQVNWLNENLKYISSDIQLFDCQNNLETLSMKVVAPGRAVEAVVYAVSHTSIPIKVTKVSFRK